MAKRFAFTVAAGVVSGVIILAIRSRFQAPPTAQNGQTKGYWA